MKNSGKGNESRKKEEIKQFGYRVTLKKEKIKLINIYLCNSQLELSFEYP